MSAAATLKAVSATVDILTAISELAARLELVNSLLRKAHAEGRDITEEELSGIAGMDDAAKARLQKAIDAA